MLNYGSNKPLSLPLATRILLSLSSILVGYASGLAVLKVLRLARWQYLNFFAFDFGFHAIVFALMSFLGWLLFLLPFVVTENWRKMFQRPLRSALVGGIAGCCLLTMVFLSFLGAHALALPDYRRSCSGYTLCAFAIGFVATGLYVALRNQMESKADLDTNAPA
jgi:hypothetical protein